MPTTVRAEVHRTSQALAMAVVMLTVACGKRLPPPPPSPDYSPDAVRSDARGRRVPSGAGDSDASFGSLDYRPRPDAPGPLDAIVASPWSSHDGIEERVDWWLDFWGTRGRASFSRYLTRMGRYVDFVDRELAARGMPPSLRYLPIVEAGYFPPAVSPVGAGGLWQFMPATARWLGLEVGTLVDQRLDPYLATPVALEYLLSLNDQFGSWFLTLAAYNSGPGRIERIIKQYGGGDPRDDALFWKISDRLPQETRDFIPKFLATARVASSPGDYGFGSVPVDPPQAFEDIRVRGAVSMDVLAEVAEATVDQMEELNPQLVRGLTPAGETTLVRVPLGRGPEFEARLAAIPERSRVTFTEHVIAQDETLSHVAVMYRVSLSELQAANPQIQPRRLRVGTRVTIPRRGVTPVVRTAEASSTSADSETGPSGGSPDTRMAESPRAKPGKVHVVSRGESLWRIARRYDVSVGTLREWNEELGSSDATIHPGDELRVRESGSKTYTVRSGDTMWDIAREHGLSTDELLRYNGLSGRGGFIRPGDQVQIPLGR